MSIILQHLGLTPEQLGRRRHSIGGSDANIIMGGDEEKLLNLWRQKRGEVEPDDLSDILAVQMGSYTEPFNVAWFEKQTGYQVTGRGLEPTHSSLKYMTCTLDGTVSDDNENLLGVFEAKHCGPYASDAEIFARYVPQLTHNCLVMASPRAWLSVFKGNADWLCMEYEVDQAYADRLLAAERNFWDCVQSGRPPAPLPPEPRPKPVGVKEYNMEGSNAWCAHAGEYLETMFASERHEIAKNEIKALVPEDASKCIGAGLEVRRDKRGSLRIKVTGEE